MKPERQEQQAHLENNQLSVR